MYTCTCFLCCCCMLTTWSIINISFSACYPQSDCKRWRVNDYNAILNSDVCRGQITCSTGDCPVDVLSCSRSSESPSGLQTTCCNYFQYRRTTKESTATQAFSSGHTLAYLTLWLTVAVSRPANSSAQLHQDSGGTHFWMAQLHGEKVRSGHATKGTLINVTH